MDINATFIGQIIVFLIMLWFIAKVVVPMIATPINERYKKIAEGLAAAEARPEGVCSRRARARIRSCARRASAREQIEEQAQRRSTETIEAAKQAAPRRRRARSLAAAQAEVGNESARASEQLRREFGALVVKAASQLLEREIDPRDACADCSSA